MKVLIAGDFCQRHRVDEIVRQKRYGELFDNVKPIIEQADYSIVNFEFPIILNKSVANPIPKCGPNLCGTIESVGAIKYAGFDCCTLANNHILDQGEKCCLDTKCELENAGIDTVGVGENIENAAEILYKELAGEILAVINCCEHEFSIATETKAGANPLNPIRQYYKIQEARRKADYVLVIVHGGHEMFQLPSLRMKEIYHFFIDSGVDAIVNHHQHCYSGYEVYRGKPIFYGIGNFMFDYPSFRHTAWNEGFIAGVDFNKKTINCQCIPYSQCNDEPKIVLMEDLELDGFNKSISCLNENIVNDIQLKDAVEKYYRDCYRSEICALEPYSSKLFRKLYLLHLLPSWISGNKLAQILNHVECEAHRDKLVFALTKLNKIRVK